MQHPILSLLAKKLIFLERGIKNGVASIGRSSRRASQVRRCTFASTAAAPLLPAPAPVPRVLALLLLPPRPPRTRPGTGAHTRVAQHELHSKCQPHPAAVHHKTARARRSRRPDPCVPRTAPREPQRPTSTASCAMHCTPLTQDLQRQAPHLHRPCPRAAPCPNIAPGRMGCDWPMTDQSAVRCTADMHNAATLLNLVQLSVAVASISTGLIVKLSRAPSGPLVLHGRKLSQVSVSTVAELTAAVGDSAVDKILVAAGTYDFTSDMCSGSAVCIDRALTIEAQVPGSVVLDAKGGRRVFEIQSSGTAELIGLNITGGSTSLVQSVCLVNLLQHFLHRPNGTSRARFLACRAGDSLSPARQH